MSKVQFRHVEPGIRPIPKWTPWQNLVVHFRRLRVVGVFLFQDIQLCLRSTLHCVFRAECTNAQALGCSMGFYCQNKSSNDCMQRYEVKTLGWNTPRQKKKFLNQCQGIRINQWSPSSVFKHSYWKSPRKKNRWLSQLNLHMDRGFLPDSLPPRFHRLHRPEIYWDGTGPLSAPDCKPRRSRSPRWCLGVKGGAKTREKISEYIYILLYMGKYESESYVVILDVILDY